ncbi:hypothetical protein NL364_31740, partial [Klebsiella pneumoniae]|nr:hypothetical protein [Klebsiella pneumoniae]
HCAVPLVCVVEYIRKVRSECAQRSQLSASVKFLKIEKPEAELSPPKADRPRNSAVSWPLIMDIVRMGKQWGE